jgi:hypothetical protein
MLRRKGRDDNKKQWKVNSKKQRKDRKKKRDIDLPVLIPESKRPGTGFILSLSCVTVSS